MAYKSSKQMTWEKSPIFNVLKYRNAETLAKEEVLENFLDWYEDEIEDVYATEEEEKEEQRKVKEMRSLIQSYLEYDMEKVRAGEQELYQQWINASKA